MQPSPFVFDRPLGADDLVGRAAERDALVRMALGGQSTRLAAPRRYGKTTLIAAVMAAVREQGMEAVRVDLDGVLTAGQVVERIAAAFDAQLGSAPARAVRALLRGVVRVRLGVVEWERDRGRGPDPLSALHAVLAAPEEVVARTGRRVLVAFDEFQQVDRLRDADAVQGTMRSRVQHQREAASYLFAGSQPGLLAMLFEDGERPFFGQATAVDLPPLPDDALAEYVAERFAATGRDAGPALEPLLGVARGHPQRAMMLADALWSATPDGTTATAEAWDGALAGCDARLAEVFERLWDRLPRYEAGVLRAVAAGSSSLFNRGAAERYGLGNPRGAQRARDELLRKGDLRVDAAGRLEVTDPMLRRWLAALDR